MRSTSCHAERRRVAPACLRALVLGLGLLPAAASAAGPLGLVPEPRSLVLREGAAPMGSPWSLASDRAAEDAVALDLLAAELRAAYGWRTRPFRRPGAPAIELVRRPWPSGADPLLREQGYDLTITPSRITIAAETARGRYYGVQTLRQIVRTTAGAALPCLTLRDAPRLAMRGVSEDIGRGQLPTLASLCATVRELGYYKLNMYQLYLEDVYDFAALRASGTRRDRLTADELAALAREAERHHVTLVPVLQTLGHQERLLASPAFQHLAEIRRPPPIVPWLRRAGAALAAFGRPRPTSEPVATEPDDDRPASAALCPIDPRARALMRGFVGELCRAAPGAYLHCGGDEPFEVGRGRSRGAVARLGLGAVYARYYADLDRAVRAQRRRMMLYGDVLLEHEAARRDLPKDVIVVDWHYDPLSAFGSVDTLRRAGFRDVIASAGLWNWRAFHPDYRRAFPNIRGAARGAKRYRGLGALVGSWGDGGAECLNASNWAGYAYLASCAWERDEPEERAFLERYARTAYGAAGARVAEAERRLGWADLAGRPWHGRVFAKPPTLHLRTDDWRAAMQATRADMRAALSALTPAEGSARRHHDRLAALRHAAERYLLLADRELLLDDVARELRAGSGAPLPDGARARIARRLRTCAERTAGLADQYETLWLASNRREGIEPLIRRLKRQELALRAMERRARDGTLREWRPGLGSGV